MLAKTLTQEVGLCRGLTHIKTRDTWKKTVPIVTSTHLGELKLALVEWIVAVARTPVSLRI